VVVSFHKVRQRCNKRTLRGCTGPGVCFRVIFSAFADLKLVEKAIFEEDPIWPLFRTQCGEVFSMPT